MEADGLAQIVNAVSAIDDPKIKGLFENAINDLGLHEKRITSILQKIKNEIRGFDTKNRSELVGIAIMISTYAYENIDKTNPYHLQKLCEFLLLKKDVDKVISLIEKFLETTDGIDSESIDWLTITLASAYSWKDKKYQDKAIQLLEELHSDSLRVKDNLAKLYYHKSDYDKVIGLVSPGDQMNSQLALWYGKSLFQKGKVNEAIDLLDKYSNDNDISKFIDQIKIQQHKPAPSDRQLRGVLLKELYDKRSDDWVQIGLNQVNSPEEKEKIRIATQLQEHGLIELRNLNRHLGGMARINANGIDVIEGSTPPPIAMNIDKRQTINISGSSAFQIGDGNSQTVENSVISLVKTIEASDASDAEKQEAKTLLRQFLEHPLVAAVGGGLVGLLGGG